MAKIIIRTDVLIIFLTVVLSHCCRINATTTTTTTGKLFEPAKTDWRCVPIQVNFCQEMYYNKTIDMKRMRPDPVSGIESQQQSKMFIEHFQPLFKTKCSKYLKILLCSVFVPLCDDLFPTPVTACRNLCLEVKTNCYRYFQDLHQPWPDKLNCSLFPEQNTENNMCITGGLDEESPTKHTRVNNAIATKLFPAVHSRNMSYQPWCNSPFMKKNRDYKFIPRLGHCALACSGHGLFTNTEQYTAGRWIVALTSFLVTLATFALLLILSHSRKFSDSERPLVYMVVCYFFFSIAYLIHGLKSRESVSCFKHNRESYLIVDGSMNISCTISFLLGYGFFLSQNIWWVCLCLSWFLRVVCKNNEYLVSRFFRYFHLIAWGSPSVICVVVLLLRKIDADELTGVCSTGNHYNNLSYLRNFIIAPMFTLLVMGVTFLLTGFACLYRRTNYAHSAEEKFILKMHPVIFAVIHSFFSLFILSSFFYEYLNKVTWYENPLTNGPNFYIFLLRLIAKFCNGLIISLWIIGLILPSFYSNVIEKLLLQKFYLQKLDTPTGAIVSTPTNTRYESNDTQTSETSI